MNHRSARRDVMAAAVVAALAAILSLSCNRSKQDSRPTSPPPVAPVEEPAARTGEHWVQDERLRAVMGQISEHSKKWPAGLPDDPEAAQSRESQDAYRDAAALADGLADAAERIPRTVRGRRMAAADRRGFNAEADRLRRQSLELKSAAEGRRVERMQRALDAISSTCVSCHGRYRDVAGELRARKARAD